MKRVEPVLIVFAHLALLAWILYALVEGGGLNVPSLLLHFCGMAIYGSTLIAFCAWRAKRKYHRG